MEEKLTEVSQFIVIVQGYLRDRIFLANTSEDQMKEINKYVDIYTQAYGEYRKKMSFRDAYRKAQAELIEQIMRDRLLGGSNIV